MRILRVRQYNSLHHISKETELMQQKMISRNTSWLLLAEHPGKKQRQLHDYIRMEIIYMNKVLNMQQLEIAQMLHLHHNTVNNIMKNFKRSGRYTLDQGKSEY